LGYAICLQKNTGRGWKTVSWNYPKVLKMVYGDNIDEIIKSLYWRWDKSREEKQRKSNTDKGIGVDLINKMRNGK